MSRLKHRMRMVALLAIVALIDPAGAWGDCSDPSPITLVSATAAGNTLTTTLSNPTSNTLSGYVYGSVQAGGRSIQFEGPVTVLAQSTATFEIRFRGAITFVEEVGACGTHGVSDTSDPIVQVVPQEM